VNSLSGAIEGRVDVPNADVAVLETAGEDAEGSLAGLDAVVSPLEAIEAGGSADLGEGSGRSVDVSMRVGGLLGRGRGRGERGEELNGGRGGERVVCRSGKRREGEERLSAR
jgi:hypothetical protein